MLNWLRKLLEVEEPRCRACEILERQLEIERARFNLVLDKITNNKTEPVNHVEEDYSEMKPIQTTSRKFIPAAVRAQMAQQNDEKTLEIMKERWREIHTPVVTAERNEELEKELLETDVLSVK